MNLLLIITTPLVACVICAMLIVLLRPLLQRYALARPNARSSHSVPTPQGGGVAVIAAVITSAAISVSFFGAVAGSVLLAVLAAAVFLALFGAYDDLRTMPVLPRLLIQAAAVGIVLATLPAEFHLVQGLPVWAERVLLLIGGLWFVNLVNFMDGLDWMTVAEAVPLTAALALFGFYGQLPLGPTLVALALCGAMIGFAPFNKPVAKLFLGDVGSLPIGLLMGWCLLQLAGSGHLVAALLLPMYYLADATLTLLKRLMRGEAIWVAHRSHFYQQATNNGFSVMQVVGEVFILNIVLAAFAAVTIWQKSPYVQGITLAFGVTAVALVLGRFSHQRKPVG
ncbi:MraY family glycosyltransferase [Afipia birgiae]|jgi:UDP-N-acetylmuramyl pentapeptide phosphotransferase/UDP-N-acetylglucosamine-1-phosphate transferase|uniref:MraY family glycosyltransferase n=1 Tax=Afipia birgiae TaxID=151414 RepID=UPI0002E8B8C8|nr:glycosyltransferase family 4 protein [Afipia birgiae]